MSQLVRLERHGEVGVIVIDNPPVNALGWALRHQLEAALAEALAEEQIQIIVLRAEGRTFPAGADISEFGKPARAPMLPDLLNKIEASPKPVIAAIHGTALGGGLEVALAAHYRMAVSSARLGLPEVTLGILPGAGGTQRLPRLIGAAEALSMMVGGKPIAAAKALGLGLLDLVVEDGDLPAQALAYARQLLAEGAKPRPTRDRRDGMADLSLYNAAIAEARQQLKNSPLPGPRRIVDCVEAAMLLPYDQGQDYERAAFQELVASPQAAGLRHAFFSERRAAKIPEASASPRSVGVVGVVGAGLMGSGIAYACLQAGYRVLLMDRDPEGVAKGLANIAKLQDGAVQKGRLSPEKREADWARLTGVVEMQALSEADLVIEAVFEDFDVKAALLRALDLVLKPGAIFATNTSYLDVDALAQQISRPQDVIGLHFFSPAHVMRLLEVVVGKQTAPEVVATGLALARKLGKVAVRTGVCDGFIGNRILTAYRQAAEYLVEDGALPSEVDGAMRDFGMPLGPFEVSDMAGLQISWARRKRLAASRDPNMRYVAIADRLCEAGRFGQSTGKGWYLYEGRKPVEDPEVARLIADERADKRITPQDFTKEEIQLRCLCAMANEGAKILAERIALRPSDIDVVMLFGYGFPRWEGGPMHWANRYGTAQLKASVESFAPQAPAFWVPSSSLSQMIRTGVSFADLNEV